MEKVALVTGSTNNIGKAIAEVLAQQGFQRTGRSKRGIQKRLWEEANRI